MFSVSGNSCRAALLSSHLSPLPLTARPYLTSLVSPRPSSRARPKADPDPTVTTVRVGSETASDTREGSMHCAERVRLGLGGLWRRAWAERKEGECSPVTVSGDRKRPTFDRLYCRYSYPLGCQTDSECDETWQAAYLHYNNTA